MMAGTFFICAALLLVFFAILRVADQLEQTRESMGHGIPKPALDTIIRILTEIRDKEAV